MGCFSGDVRTSTVPLSPRTVTLIRWGLCMSKYLNPAVAPSRMS